MVLSPLSFPSLLSLLHHQFSLKVVYEGAEIFNLKPQFYIFFTEVFELLFQMLDFNKGLHRITLATGYGEYFEARDNHPSEGQQTLTHVPSPYDPTRAGRCPRQFPLRRKGRVEEAGIDVCDFRAPARVGS